MNWRMCRGCGIELLPSEMPGGYHSRRCKEWDEERRASLEKAAANELEKQEGSNAATNSDPRL